MSKKLPITPFDMATLKQSTQMFKALIPYLDYNLQKSLSLFIRANEFRQTMNFFNSPKSRTIFKSCSSKISLNNDPISINELLSDQEITNSVLIYCPDKYISLIKNIQQFVKMSDLFSAFNSMEDAAGNQAYSSHNNFSALPPDIFGAFMNPEQQQLYNDYLKELDKLDQSNIPEDP